MKSSSRSCENLIAQAHKLSLLVHSPDCSRQMSWEVMLMEGDVISQEAKSNTLNGFDYQDRSTGQTKGICASD